MSNVCPLQNIAPTTRPEMVQGLKIEYSKGFPGSDYEWDGPPAYSLQCKTCGRAFIAGMDITKQPYRQTYPTKCLSPNTAVDRADAPGTSS